MKEVWQDIEGYEGVYQVSNYGRVRRQGIRQGSTDGHILAPHFNYGYPTYKLYNRDSGKMFYAHRLVAAAFIGPCPDGHEVNHINGDRTDPRPDNLEYVTRAENIQNALDRGSKMGAAVPGASLKGSDNHQAKLDEEKVRWIRREYNGGHATLAELSEACGVTKQAVWMAAKRKTWKHVD